MPFAPYQHFLLDVQCPFWVFSDILINVFIVTHSAKLQELRDKDVQRVPDAAKDEVGLVGVVVGQPVREMGFVNPNSIVNDTFTFEPCVLQGYVQREFHDHIRTSGDTSNGLEILAKEGVAWAWVGGVADYWMMFWLQEPWLIADEPWL